jgi:hypothetical protein
MIDVNLKRELLAQVEQLPPESQRRVVDFATRLARSAHKGTPGNTLLRFAGTMDPADAKAMMDAVELGCERIDRNTWQKGCTE